MQLTTLFMTLSAAAGLALAASTSSTNLDTCQRIQSDLQGMNVTYLPDMIHLRRSSNASFNVPANARGPCSLIAAFPADYSIRDSSVEQGGNPIAVNVTDVDGPTPDSLVGTVRFPSALPGPTTKEAVKITINSFACREKMTYHFEAAELGLVQFKNTADAGLFIEYSC
ncbi:hypothetical protein QC764_210830 [Podospora pseudoanserina]|uniref:Ubiquitin 3 binding protein But2 C-terminal domain-containing protein n=1 Tax=Podospora pseudoanserina TaxID=2609844 RepID=A0ABR0IK94_9PEZI|nr:hypothetical protein QC764_210830 [Podospora pseudoanserina]